MPNPTPLPIEHLPPPIQSKLRSTQILTSLPQIISELIQNALDADARHIDVGVDCDEWECWVRDNGGGIAKDGLARIAGEGRYNTSKAYSPASLGEVNTFGFRGEALASAADVSCMEISSRTSRSRESWSVILKGGSCLYHGPSVRWRRESQGTVVSIRDAFYNLPIRRRSHPSPQKTLDMIRKDMETFALVFPGVSFTLEETGKTRWNRGPHRILSIPKTESSVSAFRNLYGRALAEHVNEIDEESNDLRIQGFISLEGAHSKSHQFLYLNRHPLAACDLKRVIDSKFAASSFAKHAFDEYGEMSQPRPAVRRSPRKTEKKPVYVLNITVPPQQVDNCLEPAKAVVHLRDSGAVSSFLSSVIQKFLIQHGFASEQQKRPREMRQEDLGSPRKKRKLPTHRLQEDPSAQSFAPIPNRGSSTQSRSEMPVISLQTSSEAGNVVWTDPHSGIRYHIDKRTGNSYPLSNNEITPSRDETPEPSHPRTHSRRTISRQFQGNDVPQWIHRALEANRAYALTERKIASLSLPSSSTPPALSQSCNHNSRWHDMTALPWDSMDSTRVGRLKKEDLEKARVVGQVDRKFIACVLERYPDGDDDENGKSSTLFLIDQHAADERVRVERFMKELCLAFLRNGTGAKRDDDDVTERLEPPVPVLLTRGETLRIVQSEETRDVFRRWGVEFVGLDKIALGETGEEEEEEELDENCGYTQVMVKSVPRLLRDKLLMNDELRDLLKSTLAHLETTGYPSSFSQPSQSQTQSDIPVWQRALRWCPPHLVDLLNSKACRGAIMFNDPLTLEQCERLVGQLSRTDAPFVCAHGRPSLVPLVSVEGRACGVSGEAGVGNSGSDGVRRRLEEGKGVDWETFGVAVKTVS
ncbi:hypothetical protein BXZ70DRAFT_895863 [Cristinia sonorae]|uniref:MutL C-terminal dimerisation domain-containing protein n=1 Tax=Cristinia sonorae TaxID=1940300 RepID=A0A8K0UMC9_9AGAR|nr:hypothetical protein BXZ70DRAFT_895863 [Cristinia sonorae]